VSLHLTDTSAEKDRTLINSSKFFVISNLVWSPHDSRIAFVGAERAGAFSSGQIFVIDVDDRTYHVLQGTETLNIIPVWSSDGTMISFMRTLGEEAISVKLIDISSNEVMEVGRIEQSIVNQPIEWVPER